MLLVGLEVALEPHDLGVALEREHVRGDAVEEPAIVGDDHRAAREGQQRLLERAQRVDVEIVGRLVEQQHVAAAAQQLGQVHAVALAAREHADLALLVGALEVEAGDVGARVDLAVADLDVLVAARRSPPRRSSRGRARRATGRRRRGRRSRRARSEPASGFSSPTIIRNSVVLPAPLGPITPTIPAGGSVKERSSISSRSPKPLRRSSASITVPPRRGPGGMWIWTSSSLALRSSASRRLVAVQASLGLGAAALGVRAHPLELCRDRALARRLGLLLLASRFCFCSSHEE